MISIEMIIFEVVVILIAVDICYHYLGKFDTDLSHLCEMNKIVVSGAIFVIIFFSGNLLACLLMM